MRVVPGQPRPDPETLRQFRDARFGEPGLRRFTAIPQINPAGAGLAVEVILPDQPFVGEAAIDWRARGASLHRLLPGAFRQIELNDNDAIGHGRLLAVQGGDDRPNSAPRSKAVARRHLDGGSSADDVSTRRPNENFGW